METRRRSFCHHQDTRGHRIMKTQLVGIVNVTPDSFSDGGVANNAQTALMLAKKHFDEGAHIIDIGAESTRPGATPISIHEEWDRLQPVLKLLEKKLPKAVLSIDTYHAETVAKLVTHEIDWINDVSGGCPEIAKLISRYDTFHHVIMHNLGVPANKDKTLPASQDPISAILHWAEEKLIELERIGLSSSRIILDPGIGFGKTPEQSVHILRHIKELKILGVPLMVGHSRKSFLSFFGGTATMEEKDKRTAEISAHLQREGVEYIRVHNVKASMDAMRDNIAPPPGLLVTP
ncbi:MAG: dihydropteroate synthase [Proteobacteria bacterium]|nr:dihydropteroate synthase [Pseudomonadota bacterium]